MSVTEAMTDELLFKPGDIVQLNDLSKAKAKLPNRRGVIVGSVRNGRTQIKVVWSGLTKPEVVHRTFLQLADSLRD